MDNSRPAWHLVESKIFYFSCHLHISSISGGGSFQKFKSLKSSCVNKTISSIYIYTCIWRKIPISLAMKGRKTSSDEHVGGNMRWTRACRELYDFLSTRLLTTISPCKIGTIRRKCDIIINLSSFFLKKI